MKDANYCPSTLAVLISEVVLRNADIRLAGGDAVKWPPVDLQWREPVTSLFATEDVLLSVTSLFAIEDVPLCESGDEPLAAFIFLLFLHIPLAPEPPSDSLCDLPWNGACMLAIPQSP